MTAAERRALSFSGVALALLLAGSVAAEPTASERVLAEALFQEAKGLMDEERWDEACPKLEESHRLDPLAGVLLNMAVCHERQGRTATAWSELKEALALAKIDRRADREELAREHIEALEPQLSRMVIVVPPELSDIEGVVVLRNGVELVAAAWGIPVPVDPGAHTVEVSAPGYLPQRMAVEAVAAQLQVVNVPALLPEPTPTPKPKPVPAAAPPPGPIPVPPPAPADHADPSTSPLLLAGWIVGGVGVTSALMGVGFGIHAIAAESDAKGRCSETTCPDAEALAQSDAAARSAVVADVAFFAGLGLIAGGVTLILVAPDDEDAASLSVRADSRQALLSLTLPLD